MLGVPTLRSEMAAAHIRFANKVQASAQKAGHAPQQASADATHHDCVTLTQAIMKSLPSQHRGNVYTEGGKTAVQESFAEHETAGTSPEQALQKSNVKATLKSWQHA